jgi:hypothetical protein
MIDKFLDEQVILLQHPPSIIDWKTPWFTENPEIQLQRPPIIDDCAVLIIVLADADIIEELSEQVIIALFEFNKLILLELLICAQ